MHNCIIITIIITIIGKLNFDRVSAVCLGAWKYNLSLDIVLDDCTPLFKLATHVLVLISRPETH